MRDIFVCTTKDVFHALFYNLLWAGKLHNKNIRTENNKIAQFNINDITIQENPTYFEVSSTIDKLNLMLTYQ